MITARALPGLPEVFVGDDLAALIATARDALDPGIMSFDPGDVLVVAHKVVSKAEGRVVALRDVEPTERAVTLAASWARTTRARSRSSCARAPRSCAPSTAC
jgi:coenzyme F420-0:L-glutamate ligase/coenzyme F420-1:gamma-L-glutamate ligase